MKKFNSKLDNFFQITERGSNVKTELIAGLTTFFAMCYILIVNPSTIGNGNPTIFNAVFIATCLGAFVGTLLMSLYGKMPFAQAPGMGLNAFLYVAFIVPAFSGKYTMIEGYQSGLAVILLSGILFMFLSATGIRKKIAESLPDCLKKSMSAGIGLFIAFIGLKNAGLVQFNPYTYVQLGNINLLNGVNSLLQYNADGSVSIIKQAITWAAVAPIIVAFVGLMIIAILDKKKVKGSIIIGILVSTVLFYLCTWTAPVWKSGSIGQSFKDFGQIGFGGCFKGFGPLFKNATFGSVMNVIMLTITFCLVDMFDTLGTLQGTATQAGMLDENGLPQNLNKCLMCDSIATVAGGVFGTSTVTTFVESASGVAAGGRTGLTSLVIAFLFIIGMFLAPLFMMIPSCATAPALIYVGVLMLKNFKDVDMSDMSNAVPAFLTLIMMPLTYSVSNGIALGMISYTVIRICTGKFKKKDIMVAVIAVLFILRYFLITI